MSAETLRKALIPNTCPDIDRWKGEMKDLIKRLRKLDQFSIHDLMDEVEDIVVEMSTLESSLDDLRGSNQDLRSVAEEAICELEDAGDDLVSRDKEIGSLKDQLAEAESEARLAKGEVERYSEMNR